MKKNILKLSDAVMTIIECSCCLNKHEFYGDVFECAESADDDGWIVNRAGKVKCPSCVTKTKRGTLKNKK